MAGESIYSFLLSQGAPPEVILRLMNQIKSGSSVFDNKGLGMKGNLASKPPLNGPLTPRGPIGRY
jgi:hypothetical protein